MKNKIFICLGILAVIVICFTLIILHLWKPSWSRTYAIITIISLWVVLFWATIVRLQKISINGATKELLSNLIFLGLIMTILLTAFAVAPQLHPQIPLIILLNTFVWIRIIPSNEKVLKGMDKKNLEKRFDQISARFKSTEQIIEKMGILFSETKNKYPAEKPVVDEITKKFLYLWHRRHILKKTGFFGLQTCSCGVKGTKLFILLPSPKNSIFILSNSFTLHRLVWHRNEIPLSEFDKIAEIINECPEEEPTVNDLAPAFHQ